MNEQCYYRISIKALVHDREGRVLLAREKNGMYELLGGGLEHGEIAHAALRRELKEETGLTASYISTNPVYFITSKRLGFETYIANLIYEVRLDNLNFVASEECTELSFFTVEESRTKNIYPNVKAFLDVYNPSKFKY